MKMIYAQAIVFLAIILGCSAQTQKSNVLHRPLIVHDSDVVNVFSARTALILHDSIHCLYDIENNSIVEKGVLSVEHQDGYLMTKSIYGKEKKFRLYDSDLVRIREWKADSSRILADGFVTIKLDDRWDIVDHYDKTVYSSQHAVFFAQLPLVVIDSASVLYDIRTGKVIMDSVVMLFRLGDGAIVEQLKDEESKYYWLGPKSNSSRMLGQDILWRTGKSIVVDSNKYSIVYDSNLREVFRSDKYFIEYSDFVRVEYSQSARTWCFIDLVGSDTRCGYDGIQPDGSGCYIVSKDRKWGLLRYDGKVIIPITHPILPDKSRNSHVSVTTLPSYRGDNVIKFYTSDWKVSYYYYDINGYSRLFPD